MKPVKIKEDIYWVGGIDWELRNFHGYLTQRGSTYNAYLIIDEKVTLIDTVKDYLYEEMLERVSEIIDPKKIDYIISNHVEMDHSGAIPDILEVASNAQLIASPNGAKGLKAHFGDDLKVKVIKPGETLNIGKRNLSFVLAPMVHWPDNMVEYCPEEKMLFSNDAFGQHYASSQRFDDELSIDLILEEAKKYYANIVLGYNGPVRKLYEEALKLDIETICPSHGLIWRGHVKEILAKYDKWSSNTTDKTAVIVYDTMWHSTEAIAIAMCEAFENKGIDFKLFNVQDTHISDIMTHVINAEYICVGSPTLNNGIMPTVSSFLTYLKGLSPGGRKAIAFGSYGWGGQSVGIVKEELEKCKFDVIEQIKVNYIPKEEQLNEIKANLEKVLS